MKRETVDWVQYVEQASQLLDLPIAPDYLPEVVANLESIAAIAQLVSEFPLPEDIEAVTIFEP
ncbi:MAG: DUF4089 domain-containing protein [Cyanobacteria bacterium P01_E01_bin.42]